MDPRSPEPEVTIRNALATDLEAVTGVFFDCWHMTYPNVLPAVLVARMDRCRAASLWARVFREGGGEDLLVAERGGREPTLLGVTRFAVGAGEGMIHSLYVSPQAQGSGIGSRLLTEACHRLGEAGVGIVRLWVFEHNTPSREFYLRHGFHPDGERRTQEEFGEPELRLSRLFGTDRP